MIGDNDDDFDDDWSDGDDDDFEEGGFDDFDEPAANAPKKGSPLLIMGGALVAIVAIGGYLAKDIVMPADPVSTPASLNAANTAPVNNLSMQAEAPGPITTTSDPALDAYTAENGALISDDDFADNASDNPFDDFTTDFNNTGNLEDNSIAVPFDTPNTGDPNDETVVKIETLTMDDLNPAQDPTMGMPNPAENQNQDENTRDVFQNFVSNNADNDGPDVVAQPVGAVDATEITAASQNEDTAVHAEEDRRQRDGLRNQLGAAEIEIKRLNGQIDYLNGEMAKLQDELEKAKEKAASAPATAPAPAAKAEPAPVKKSSRTTSSAPVKTKTPTPPPPRNWVLRAANVNEATVSEAGSNELLTLRVGDMVPGYGRIQAIHWDPQDGWEVITTGGKLSQ